MFSAIFPVSRSPTRSTSTGSFKNFLRSANHLSESLEAACHTLLVVASLEDRALIQAEQPGWMALERRHQQSCALGEALDPAKHDGGANPILPYRQSVALKVAQFCADVTDIM